MLALAAATAVLLLAASQGLRDHGYVEGRNILIEYRSADGNIERLPGLATELARLKVDLIVAGATPAGRAARAATATIPIIVMAMGDPVGDGLVASLARPGANLTGTTFLGPALVPKHLALLKEALPRATLIAMPSVFNNRQAVELGGLMSYGTSLPEPDPRTSRSSSPRSSSSSSTSRQRKLSA